jgi:xeroderma pigmentosum group C-complementing protein
MGPKRKKTVKTQDDENIKKPSNKQKKVENSEPVPTKSNEIKTREQQIEELLLQKEINKNNGKYFSQEVSTDIIKLKSRKSPVKKSNNKKKQIEKEDDEDSDEDEWDDVKINDDVAPSVVSQNTIEIKIDSGKKKRQNKSNGFDFAAYMVRTYKNFQKKLTVEMHKAHIVCWVYHGLYLNKLTTNKFINAIALSLCDQFLMEFKNEAMCIELVNDIFKFLRGKIVKSDETSEEISTFNRISILLSLQNLKYKNNLEFILLILAFLRCLNIKTRLCISFDVVPLKEENDEKKKKSSVKKSSNKKDESSSEDEDEMIEEIITEKNKPTTRPVKNRNVRQETEKIKDEEEEEEEEEPKASSTKTLLKRKCNQVKNYDILSDDDQDDEFKIKEIKSERTKTKKRKRTIKKESSKEEEEEEEEYDEKANILKLKSGKTELKKNPKVLSDDDENLSTDIKNELTKPNDYFNYWIEVYLDKEERWISIDPLKLKFDSDNHFEKRLNQRILYVCSFDNDNKIKDVTKRYANEWNTQTRKLRIEHFDTTFWFDKLLVKYKPIDYQISNAEDKVLNGESLCFHSSNSYLLTLF